MDEKYKNLTWLKIISDSCAKLEYQKKIELEGYVCPLVGNISMPTKIFFSFQWVNKNVFSNDFLNHIIFLLLHFSHWRKICLWILKL